MRIHIVFIIADRNYNFFSLSKSIHFFDNFLDIGNHAVWKTWVEMNRNLLKNVSSYLIKINRINVFSTLQSSCSLQCKFKFSIKFAFESRSNSRSNLVPSHIKYDFCLDTSYFEMRCRLWEYKCCDLIALLL